MTLSKTRIDRLSTKESVEELDRYYDTPPIEVSNPMLVEVFDNRGMYCSRKMNRVSAGAVKG